MLLYCLNHIINIKRVINLQRATRLPCAALYYRRAIEYYWRHKWLSARADLAVALALEPNFMAAHYGLRTIYSLLARKATQAAQRSRYQHRAFFHLKQAILTGWSHWQDYTLQDPNFQALELSKHTAQLRVYDQLRRQNKQRLVQFQKRINELVAQHEYVPALRLLYFSRPSYLGQAL